jgi:hypothetical protein
MSTVVDKEYLGYIAPEFCDIDQRRLNVLNDAAECYVSEDVFGDCAMQAKAYVIAHLAKLGDNEGTGPVVSEKVGDLARSYSGPATNATDWAQTSYGQQFKKLACLHALPTGDLFVV